MCPRVFSADCFTWRLIPGHFGDLQGRTGWAAVTELRDYQSVHQFCVHLGFVLLSLNHWYLNFSLFQNHRNKSIKNRFQGTILRLWFIQSVIGIGNLHFGELTGKFQSRWLIPLCAICVDNTSLLFSPSHQKTEPLWSSTYSNSFPR